MTKSVPVVLMMSAASLISGLQTGVCQEVVFTDADASVVSICRNDQSADDCFVARGGGDSVVPDPFVADVSYTIRVHDQNALSTGYWHFDLSGIDANAEVLEATFQLDLQSNSWSDQTTVSVFAIADPDKDWDLTTLPEDQIVGANAPQADWETFAWTGDPSDPQQRFNSPTPYLEEGNLPSSTVRLLKDLIEIDETDSGTSGDAGDPGNEYGGVAEADGPGMSGSSDGDINPWPVKNAVEVDVTELIQWKLRQNASYSDFDPADRDLTIMVRTDGGGNGFARFVSKESPFLGGFGSLDLQSGRIVLDLGVVTGAVCDFDGNGTCDIDDIDALLQGGQAQQTLDPFDLNKDGTVNLADRDAWYVAASSENNVDLVPGDTNLDGMVVAGDLNALGTNWLRSDATSIAEGDFNGDGTINASDLNDLGQNWQHGAAAAAVPEPFGRTWLIWVAIGLLTVSRKRV